MSSKPKATKARQVLEMCRSALASLQKDPAQDWIVLWAGTLGLLRVAVECLERDTNPDIRRGYNEIFNEIGDDNRSHNRGHKGVNTQKKKDFDKSQWYPEIYYQFIHDDRNKLLHEAVSKVAQSVVVPGAFLEVNANNQLTAVSARQSASYSYIFTTGAFCGEDAREITQAAIEWIEDLIDRAERIAAV